VRTRTTSRVSRPGPLTDGRGSGTIGRGLPNAGEIASVELMDLRAKRYPEVGYLVLRLGAAFLFFFHAPQKYFGWWNSPAYPLLSLRGIAVVIEVVVSPLIALGLFTRSAAVLGAAEMIGAYAVVHRKLGLLPIANRGELAVLYFLIFVYIAMRGGGRYSLDARRVVTHDEP
jgi:putative oxidoreductase